MTTEQQNADEALVPPRLWRVAIVEDHTLVVDGLKRMINDRQDMELIWVGDSLRGVGGVTSKIDLAIVDLGLPEGLVGVDELSDLLGNGVKVVVVTGFAAPRLIRELYLAGVSDVVSKADPPDVLKEALDRLVAGDLQISTNVAAALANFGDASPSLSDREQEALALYGSGLTIGSVAKQMMVTENTVKEYLKRIRSKLADVGRPASTQRDLYREAIREGIIKD